MRAACFVGGPILGVFLSSIACSSERFYCDRALSCDDASTTDRGDHDASGGPSAGNDAAPPAVSLDSGTVTHPTTEFGLDAAVLVEAGSQTTNADASIDPLHTDSDATTSNTTPTTPDASSVSDASDATDSGAHVPQDAAALDGGPPSVEQPDAIAAECGDGILQAPEVCDGAQSTSTELGACNPQCAGHFEKKYVRATSERYSGALGGPSGADAICVEEFGDGWKALLSGGTRRATVTPNEGDATTDWVVQPYTHYYNWDEALIWRTDDVPLLGVRDGERQNLYAPLFDESSGYYAWSGFRADWTTVEDDEEQAVGNCLGWTDEGTAFGTFIKPELDEWFSDYCGSKWGLLCVEQ